MPRKSAEDRVCRVKECERKARYKSARLCQKHYFRLRRYGTTDTVRAGKAKPRLVTPNGYVRVYAPKHPIAEPGGYVFEHRKVAYDARDGEISKCERCQIVCVSWETCHVDHDDDNRKNNSPENLLVCCNGCNVMRSRKPQHSCLGRTSITLNGVTKTATEWARDPRVNVCGRTIAKRKRDGYSDEEALFAPKKTHRLNNPKPNPLKFENGKRVLA